MKILESRTLSTSPNENRFVACGSTCQLGIFLPWHDQNIQLIQLPTLIVFRNWTLYLLRVAVRWTLECNLCQYQFVSLQMDCGLWSKRVDFIDCTFFFDSLFVFVILVEIISRIACRNSYSCFMNIVVGLSKGNSFRLGQRGKILWFPCQQIQLDFIKLAIAAGFSLRCKAQMLNNIASL